MVEMHLCSKHSVYAEAALLIGQFVLDCAMHEMKPSLVSLFLHDHFELSKFQDFLNVLL